MYWALNSQGLISNSPYYLPYSSCDVSLENLVLDQLIIPLLIFFFILITCLLDIVLMLCGEILSWSLKGVKGLSYTWNHYWERCEHHTLLTYLHEGCGEIQIVFSFISGSLILVYLSSVVY